MRKILTALFCFLLTAYVSADAGIIIRKISGGVSECTGRLVCQNLEATGYDNSESWTESGVTVDPNETGTVLRGSQSLELDDTGADPSTYINFTNTDPVYGFQRVRISSDDTYDLFIVKDSSGNDCMYGKRYDPSDTIRLYCGTNYTAGTATINAGTTYYIWWEYHEGTGSNAKCKMWVGTTTTKPGEADVDKTDGNSTYTAGRVLYWSNVGTAGSLYVDQILVDDAQIGNVDS